MDRIHSALPALNVPLTRGSHETACIPCVGAIASALGNRPALSTSRRNLVGDYNASRESQGRRSWRIGDKKVDMGQSR